MRARTRARAMGARMEEIFALGPELLALPRPDTLVCRCEDVSHQTLQHYGSWTEAKIHSRCGMGACQGGRDLIRQGAG